MARPKDQETREIREFVADGEEMSREQMAHWLLQCFTDGDVKGYAEKIRPRYEAVMRRRKAQEATT